MQQQRRIRHDADSTPSVRRQPSANKDVSVKPVAAAAPDVKPTGEAALTDGWVEAKGIVWPPPGPSADHYRRVYMRGRTRAVIAVVFGLAWSLTSLYLARFWIADLGKQITLPLAIVVIAGIAMVPGYLNMQLLMSLLLDRPPHLHKPENLVFPPVSVLIAAYNEQESLVGTLRSLAAQTYPGEIRAVVIDDGSFDHTRSVACEYSERHPNEHVTVMTVPHHGKADALNAGLATLGTPLAATLDADTVLLPDSMRRAVTRMLMSGPETSAVAGSVLVKNWKQNILTRMQRWEYALGIASVKRVQALYQGTLVAQGAFSVYTTTDLREIAGWPNMVGEDIVMTWALLAKGDIVIYEPTAVALTCVPEHFRSFARQRRRWARGMIEGLRAWGGLVVRRRWLARHGVIVDYMLPFVDLMYTFAFIPGVALAFTGNFMIAGPMTLAVLPLGMLMVAVMAMRQRTDLAAIKFRRKIDGVGLLIYFLIYQAMLSPISLTGYFQEFFGRERNW